MPTNLPHLPNVLICCDPTYQPRPKPVWDVIGEPEPSEGRLVVGVKVVWVGGRHVAKDVIGLGVGCTIRHEGWDDDVETVNLESHLKFLQQLDILQFELLGDFLLHEQLADLSNTCRRSVSDSHTDDHAAAHGLPSMPVLQTTNSWGEAFVVASSTTVDRICIKIFVVLSFVRSVNFFNS